MNRPTGVTVLAILFVISGIFGVVGGIVTFNLVSLAFGVVYLAVTYGLWNGQNWSRILVIILSVLGILSSLALIFIGPMILIFLTSTMTANEMTGFLNMISNVFIVSGVVGIIVNSIIIYYLTRPHVEAFFT